MGKVFELTFFLALGLLAVVITVFVLAVSLLGRAMEVARKNEEQKLIERKESNAQEMAPIKKQIEETEQGKIPKGLKEKLAQLEKNDEKFEQELDEIKKQPELLSVKGGVTCPCAFLITALIFSGAALYLSSVQMTAISVIIWILGLIAIGYSVYRIFQSLKVIETVAVTSEGEAERRLARAVKVALVELEEEKKPKLQLVFKEEQAPFHVGSGLQKVIKFGLDVVRGDVARKTIVAFFAPMGFNFPNTQTFVQSKEVTTVGGYITTQFAIGDCLKSLTYRRDISIAVPNEKGTYSILYKLACEGFSSSFEKFDVIVD